ncbi:MAG: hypothetical protein DYG89_36115 [Caldilinea sp. CFX5]|nr:hypothetical protein [Caldilinea sp. CFX5]
MRHQQLFSHWIGRSLALLLILSLGWGLAQPALAALIWHLQTVDNAGDVGHFTSLVLDSSGNPVISYYDNVNGDLKLVRCGNATCSSGNSIQTVDSDGNVGAYTSLALDSSGNPVISYLDQTNYDLKLVRCGNADCSSGNRIQTVDSDGRVGTYTSLVLDNGDIPVISYSDDGNHNLKLVRCGTADCSSGNRIQTVDSIGRVGFFISLALNSSGNPVISYYVHLDGDLKLVRCGTADCSSGNSIQTIESIGQVGAYTSLALDSNDNPVISYYEYRNASAATLILKLVHCGNSDCSSGNSIQVVDGAGATGAYTSLVLDSNGNPVISYLDVTNFDLKLVRCGNADCSSGNHIQTLDSDGEVGEYTSLRLDSSGNPVISYYDKSNQTLKLARLEDDNTPPSITINQQAGQADPTNSNPVLFSVVFSEAVNDFSASDVTLSGTANLSGVNISVSGGPSEYTISVAGVAGNGTLIATIGANVATDAVGNGNLASTSTDNTVTFNTDSTPPVITPQVVGTLGNPGWYISTVTVSWRVVDAETPITSQAGCETQSVTSDTMGVTFTCAATSAGGSSSQSMTIQRDATPPTISAAATTLSNANGWYNSDVTVRFTCSDNVSGVASCPDNEVLSSEGAAVTATTPTINDLAGNQSTLNKVVSVKIDKTAPVVAVTGVSNGATYPVGSVPVAGCSTSDALAGVATQATLSVTGGNTDGTGTFTATCSGATDNAGNPGSASVSYKVIYRWGGFFQPVDNPSIMNKVNAGAGIPVKFSLGGNFGLNIFASGYPASQNISCSSGGSNGSDDIEETVTAGSSSLQYDATTQTYTYVWKTDKAWAGSCRQLIVRLIDGVDHVALFQFNGKGRSAEEDEQAIHIFLPLINQ